MESIYKQIEELTKLQNSPHGIGGDAAKFNEEVGEFNRLVSIAVGMQDNPFSPEMFKKQFTKEAADVIQNIFLLCQKQGITLPEIEAGIVAKNAKWESDIRNGKYEKRLMESKVGININSPTLTLRHADLKDASDDSIYKKVCPACKTGWLLVRRDDNPPHRIVADDYCILCGQHVVYSDINEIESDDRVRQKFGNK